MGRVQFVVGRAGAGKTTWVADAIAKELEQSPLGGPLYWLVPEGASYVAERLLMQRVRASVRAEVLSLSRFANGVLQRARLNVRPLTTAGRRLLLQTVLTSESHEGELKFLRSHHVSPSKLDVVLSAFDDLEQTAVGMDGFSRLALETLSNDSGLFGQKTRDICVLYLRYRAALRAMHAIDPIERLTTAKTSLAEDFRSRPAEVWIDDFHVFSPLECAFIGEIACFAKQTVVTIPLDPAWVHNTTGAGVPALFEPTYQSFRQLLDVLSARGVSWDVLELPDGDGRPVMADAAQFPAGAMPRFRGTAAVSELERLMISHGSGPGNGLSGDPLVLAAAQNRRTEVEGVAREIRGLLRQRDVLPGDIAVVVADRPLYVDVVHETFTRYEIPHTVDDYPALAGHPLGRFMLAVLDVVESGFETAAVKRLLKTEFHGLETDAADWLETYIDKYGIDGHLDWLSLEDWSFAVDPSDLEHRKANRLRRQLLAVVEPLYQSLATEALSAADVAQALWDCLERAGTKRIMASWLVSDELAVTPGQASLHEQAWTRVMDILSDLADSGGNEPHDRALLLTLVRDDLLAQPLSSIPAGMNQVLVTDLVRAHGWEAAYVFVVGAGDGALPAKAHESGLFNDDDRAWFKDRLGAYPGHTLEHLQALRTLHVYFAMTRATRQLWLSYPLSDADGKEARPASLISRLKGELGADKFALKLWVREDDTASTPTDMMSWTPDQAIRWVAGSWRKRTDRRSPLVADVVHWLSDHAEGAARLDAVRQGHDQCPSADRLRPTTAQALYGDPLAVNVHQLESFAACPYQHFARFGLRLRSAEVMDFNAAARGTLLHDTLQAFVTLQAAQLEAWRDQSDEEAVRLMRRLFDETIRQDNVVFRARKPLQRHQLTEAFRILELAAIVLTGHARHGSFSPAAVELPFGDSALDGDAGVRIDLGHGRTMFLRGRIDRVDMHQVDGKSVFRVIDYKSRRMVLNLDRIYHGLQLQLPVYAHVIEQMSEQWLGRASQAVGLLYFPLVRKAAVKSAPPQEGVARSTALKQMRAKGWMLADPEVVGLMDDRLLKGVDSELFTRVLKNDGTFTANAPVVTRSEWQAIQAHVLQLIQQYGSRISDGDIAIAPYDFGRGDTACKYCDYASLCQIDRRPSPDLYRRLGSKPPAWPAEEVRPS